MTLLCVLIPGQGCRKDTEAEEEDQKELREIENFLMTFEDWKQEDEPWQKVKIDFPEEGCSLLFLRQHAHPFMAEYDRKVVLQEGDRQSEEFELPPNTGGQTEIDVYTLKTNNSSEIWLRDLNNADSAYVFDMGKLAFRIEGGDKFWQLRTEGRGYRGRAPVELPSELALAGKIVAVRSEHKPPSIRFVPARSVGLLPHR